MTTCKAKETIEVPVWWRHNGMLTNREALPASHPESTYGYIKNVLGLRPEDYGVRANRFTNEMELLEEEQWGDW